MVLRGMSWFWRGLCGEEAAPVLGLVEGGERVGVKWVEGERVLIAGLV